MSGGERKEEEEEGRGLVGTEGRPRLAAVSVVWHKNRQEMNPLEEMEFICLLFRKVLSYRYSAYRLLVCL